MRFTLLLITLLGMSHLSAQNKWTVLAGISPEPYYTPSQLTIEVGDTIVWRNIEGTHNVVTTSGPEDFSFPNASQGWTHEFVFTQAGIYEYECSVGNHAQTQFGTITVVEEQTTYTVTVGGTPDNDTPDPYYSPGLLTIRIGDTVIWENVQGFHNVTLIDGPEDFSFSPAGSGWTHQFIFTKVGVYDYECSVGNHSQTQFGTITVEDISASTRFLLDERSIQLYPNPASAIVNIVLDSDIVLSDRSLLILTDASGKQVIARNMSKGDLRFELDLSPYSSGIYFASVLDGDKVLWSQQVIRN